MSGRTLEHLKGTRNGIIKCDIFKRMPDDEAYDRACVDVVGIGYRDFVPKGATSKVV